MSADERISAALETIDLALADLARQREYVAKNYSKAEPETYIRGWFGARQASIEATNAELRNLRRVLAG